MHPAKLTDDDLQQQCQIKRTRAGGPGGQHRNKVDTAIVITHLDSQITAQASERRSQHANRVVALMRLRIRLALEVRSSPLPEEPSALWIGRVKNRRMSVNGDHRDFPSLLVDALDQLHRAQHQVAAAAVSLNVSTSQLIKFLKTNTTVWNSMQGQRKSLGLKPLK